MSNATTTRAMQREVKRLWTVQKVARHYDVTPMTVHNWRKAGLPTVTIPGDERSSIRFVASDVKAWRKMAS